MAKPKSNQREAAESLAVQALTYLAGDPERLGRFLALTGLAPQSLRAAARESGFLAGILEHIAGNESLLTEFAADAGVDPAEIDRARRALGATQWERDLP